MNASASPPVQTAPLFGLVLRGGRSRRMGSDKAALVYHARPEAERMAELLGSVCERVYYSVAHLDTDSEAQPPALIADLEPDLGPIGGLRAAAARHPNVAWLVLACDMPGFGEAALAQLVAARSAVLGEAEKVQPAATAFLAGDGRPHPLAAIYEPAAQAAFEEAAPRRVLERLGESCHVIEAVDPSWLNSVDTPAQSTAFRDGV